MVSKQNGNITLRSGLLVVLGILIGIAGRNYTAGSVPDQPVQMQQSVQTPPTAPNLSILETNYNANLQPQDQVRNIPVPIPIYDVGYVIYSKKFAERFGYPEKYIADLDPGMQALEFRMSAKGGDLRCHLNVLLDNTLGLDFPSEEYVSRFERDGDMMRFPQQIDSWKDPKGLLGYRELPEDKEFRMNIRQHKWHYYNMNILLANYDYKADPSGKLPSKRGSWYTSQFLEGYSKKYLRGLDYVSVSTTCGQLTQKLFLRDKLSIWFKKVGGDDYSHGGNLKPEQFLKFRLPTSFVQNVVQLMGQNTNYIYTETLKIKRQ